MPLVQQLTVQNFLFFIFINFFAPFYFLFNSSSRHVLLVCRHCVNCSLILKQFYLKLSFVASSTYIWFLMSKYRISYYCNFFFHVYNSHYSATRRLIKKLLIKKITTNGSVTMFFQKKKMIRLKSCNPLI